MGSHGIAPSRDTEVWGGVGSKTKSRVHQSPICQTSHGFRFQPRLVQRHFPAIGSALGASSIYSIWNSEQYKAFLSDPPYRYATWIQSQTLTRGLPHQSASPLSKGATRRRRASSPPSLCVLLNRRCTQAYARVAVRFQRGVLQAPPPPLPDRARKPDRLREEACERGVKISVFTCPPKPGELHRAEWTHSTEPDHG